MLFDVVLQHPAAQARDHPLRQGALAMAKNPVLNKRSKHIDIRHHFIRDLVKKEKIIIQYIPTDANIADLLTKAVPKEKLEQLVPEMMKKCSLEGAC